MTIQDLCGRVGCLEEELALEKKKNNWLILKSQNLAIYPELFGSGDVYDSFLFSDKPFKPYTCDEPKLIVKDKVTFVNKDDVTNPKVVAKSKCFVKVKVSSVNKDDVTKQKGVSEPKSN